MSFFGEPVCIRFKPSILTLIDKRISNDETLSSRADYLRRIVMADLRLHFPIEFELKGGMI